MLTWCFIVVSSAAYYLIHADFHSAKAKKINVRSFLQWKNFLMQKWTTVEVRMKIKLLGKGFCCIEKFDLKFQRKATWKLREFRFRKKNSECRNSKKFSEVGNNCKGRYERCDSAILKNTSKTKLKGIVRCFALHRKMWPWMNITLEVSVMQ